MSGLWAGGSPVRPCPVTYFWCVFFSHGSYDIFFLLCLETFHMQNQFHQSPRSNAPHPTLFTDLTIPVYQICQSHSSHQTPFCHPVLKSYQSHQSHQSNKLTQPIHLTNFANLKHLTDLTDFTNLINEKKSLLHFLTTSLSGLMCPLALLSNLWIILLPDDSEHRRFSVLYKVFSVQCTMHLTLHSFSLKLCSATIDLKTWCSVLFKVCCVQCAVCSVQCALCSVLCGACSV